MKNLLLIAMAFINTNLFAQWTNIYNNNSVGDFYKVVFTDKNTGYVAGSYGIIFKTVDGGTTWTSQTISPYYAINDIYFVNNNLGFAGSGNGTIYKTTDAGSNWTPISTGDSANIRAIHFVDSTNGYAVGYDLTQNIGLIIKTTDGGNTWTILTGSTKYFNTNSLNAVYFSSLDSGVVYGAGNTRIRTVDGGVNWVNMAATIYANGTTANWYSISAPDKNNVFSAAANSFFLIKTNLQSSPGNETITWAGAASTNSYRCVQFLDSLNGFVCGLSDLIYETQNDSGYNHMQMSSYSNSTFNSVYMIDSTYGFMAGNGGIILKYGNVATSVVNETTSELIKLFPNPTTDRIHISLSNKFKSGSIKIFNTLGETIYSDNFVGNELDYKVDKGFYFIQVTADNETWTRKIINE